LIDGADISSRSSLEKNANAGMGARNIRVETRRLDSLSLDSGIVGDRQDRMWKVMK